MKECHISIPERPIPNARPRFSKQGHVFDSQRDIKRVYRMHLRRQFTSPKSGPIEISFKFYLKIPVSTSKKKTLLMEAGEVPHIKKPDIDNLEVMALNCMSGIIYNDDNQVHKMDSVKMYSSNPRTEITVRWLESEQGSVLGSGLQ